MLCGSLAFTSAISLDAGEGVVVRSRKHFGVIVSRPLGRLGSTGGDSDGETRSCPSNDFRFSQHSRA